MSSVVLKFQYLFYGNKLSDFYLKLKRWDNRFVTAIPNEILDISGAKSSSHSGISVNSTNIFRP